MAYLGICLLGLGSRKTALGRIPISRKWGKGIPGGRRSMNKGIKVGEYGQIWNPGGGCKNIRHLAKVSRRERAMALGGQRESCPLFHVLFLRGIQSWASEVQNQPCSELLATTPSKGRFLDPTPDSQKAFGGLSLSFKMSTPEILQIENMPSVVQLHPWVLAVGAKRTWSARNLGLNAIQVPAPVRGVDLEAMCRSPLLSELMMWLE